MGCIRERSWLIGLVCWGATGPPVAGADQSEPPGGTREQVNNELELEWRGFEPGSWIEIERIRSTDGRVRERTLLRKTLVRKTPEMLTPEIGSRNLRTGEKWKSGGLLRKDVSAGYVDAYLGRATRVGSGAVRVMGKELRAEIVEVTKTQLTPTSVSRTVVREWRGVDPPWLGLVLKSQVRVEIPSEKRGWKVANAIEGWRPTQLEAVTIGGRKLPCVIVDFSKGAIKQRKAACSGVMGRRAWEQESYRQGETTVEIRYAVRDYFVAPASAARP